ncbi:MAG TPA: hydroxyacid dehydrogenase [Negativicutes bacterium]
MTKNSGRKILIAEPINGSEYTYDYLRDMGCELILGPHVSRSNEGYSEDQLVSLVNQVDAIIGMSREKLTKRVLESAGRLKVICKYGMGVDHIDVKTATDKGILVTNAPVHNLTVAEFTIALMLALYKKVPRNERYIKAGGWRDDSATGYDLFGKTVGLLGLGAIGKQVAKRLQGWDVTIIAYDPYVQQEDAENLGVKLVDWETLFKSSDIISLHVPLTVQTTHIVAQKEFLLMKQSAILINTARGKLVNKNDLIEALRDGQIAGAGVDVWESEPVAKDDPLLFMENVVTSPHVAGFTFEALRRIAEQAAKNCVQALNGERPDFVVNPEALDFWKTRMACHCQSACKTVGNP